MQTERSYHLERYHRLRGATIKSLGGRCADCGTTERLEFDHIDPTLKEYNVSKWWSITEEKRSRELKKCQLLCNTCHKKKSKSERETLTHGTTMYRKGCRCGECRKAHATATARRRAAYGR